MTEKLLQYIWRHQYFNRTGLLTAEGDSLDILSPGLFNEHQGPDFLNARIKIGPTVLAGNIELHLHTSDWFRHRHQQDANYNNVILHVVYRHDEKTGPQVPVLELEPRISSLLLTRYQTLMVTALFIPCGPSVAGVKELTWLSWKERLLAERLQRKAAAVLERYKESGGHWEETFWRLLARGFGLPVNADAFEAVACSLPLTVWAKHRHSIHQLEALLLGQANLLQQEFEDDYPKLLQREYSFLKTKYNLKPVPFPVHFLRMRPQNFPTVRLAQLAMLLHVSVHLFSRILEAQKPAEVPCWLTVTANDYWHYHYRFDEATALKPKKTGTVLITSILINTVVPLLFAYGLHHKQEKFTSKAVAWLQELEAESNATVNGFRQLQVPVHSAFDSQALLELKNEYCTPKRCLECSIGNSLLREG